MLNPTTLNINEEMFQQLLIIANLEETSEESMMLFDSILHLETSNNILNVIVNKSIIEANFLDIICDYIRELEKELGLDSTNLLLGSL